MFLLTRDWAVGATASGISLCVPAGTQIDGSNPQWRGTPLPSVMPLSAQALDAAALTAMTNWYGPMGLTNWFVAKGF